MVQYQRSCVRCARLNTYGVMVEWQLIDGKHSELSGLELSIS